MRLLMLASADVVHTHRWRDWFVSRGHTVLLATLEPSGSQSPDERLLTSISGPGMLRYPLAVRSLKKLIREFGPDLINAHYLPGYGFLAALAGPACPLAISSWGSDILLNPPRSLFHRKRARYALGRADLVTCDSPVLTGGLLGLGVAREKILEEPMGIDPSLFHPPDRRENYDGPPRIISTRRHEPLYDLGTLLEALSQLQQEGIDYRAVLVGNGSLSDLLLESCRQNGLEHRTAFPGELSQQRLAELLRESEIYVSTSHSDSTSVSLLEAMACGVFPVVTDIPGNRDWITHGRNGLLFSPGDSAALAACLVQAAGDKQPREQAAEINAGMICDRAVWDNNMRRVEEAFLQLMDQDR